MSARGFYTLAAGCVLLLTALSVGSAGAFLLGCAALIALGLSLLSVILASATCRIAQSAPANQANRGEQVDYRLSVRVFSLLPIAPLSLRFTLPSGRETSFLLNARLFGETVSENAFICPHVGICHMGATHAAISDCFSFFSVTRRIHAPLAQITVLPNPTDEECPPFSPGEGEHSAAQPFQARIAYHISHCQNLKFHRTVLLSFLKIVYTISPHHASFAEKSQISVAAGRR